MNENDGMLIEFQEKNNGRSDDTAQIYIDAYKNLGELIKNKSKDFTELKELIDTCKDGQRMGIEQLQKITV